jgi:hypothetical protein
MEKLRAQDSPHMTNDMIIIGLCREIKRLEKLLAQEAQGEKLRLYAQHARGERQPWPLLN